MIRLHHANIRTSRLDDSVAFYRDVLGLTPGPAATRPGSGDHVWMSDANQVPCIHLQRHDSAPQWLEQDGRVHHLAFSCEDPEGWRRKLLKLGVEHTESEFPAANIIQFNLRDPNGVRLELAFPSDRAMQVP